MKDEEFQSIPIETLRTESEYVMYMGFPMRLYQTSDVPMLWGFWSWIPVIFALEPILGLGGWGFIKYKKGEYWPSLWKFLKGD